MEQLTLFNNGEKEFKGVLIPEKVVSPLESKEKLNSLEFNIERDTWNKYISSIKSYHGCSYFEAREMLIKARDRQEKIMIDFDFFF